MITRLSICLGLLIGSMLESCSSCASGSSGLLKGLGRRHPAASSSCLSASRTLHVACDSRVRHELLGACERRILQRGRVLRNRTQQALLEVKKGEIRI